MAEQGAEAAFLREFSECWIYDDDGAGVGVAGLGIDNWRERFIWAGGDHFCKLQARGGGERIELVHQGGWNCDGEGVLNAFGYAVFIFLWRAVRGGLLDLRH